jgi:hypothetical protein
MNDEPVFDEAYHRRLRAGLVPDGGKVFVNVKCMDGASGRYSLTDSRSEAVRLRDEAHALMVDRMTHPKNYDRLTGKRLDDGLAEDLSPEDAYALAKRLAPMLGLAVPTDYLAGRVDPTLSQSRPSTPSAPPSRGDSRRPHYKESRDRAAGLAARDAAWAGMVARMTGGRR